MKLNVFGHKIPVSFKEILFFKPKTFTEVFVYINFCFSFLFYSFFNIIITFITYNDFLAYDSNLSMYYLIPIFLLYSALGGFIYLIYYFFAVKKLLTERYQFLLFDKKIFDYEELENAEEDK